MGPVAAGRVTRRSPRDASARIAALPGRRRSRAFSSSAASSSASGSSRAGSSCRRTRRSAIHSCRPAQIWFGLHGLSGSFWPSVLAPSGVIALIALGVTRADGPPRSSSLSLGGDRGASVARVRRGPSVPDSLHGAARRPRSDRRRRCAGFARRVLHRITTVNAETAEHAERGFSAGSASSALIVAMFALIAYELRPLDPAAPMVVEAQWDRPNVPVREQVTACLGQPAARREDHGQHGLARPLHAGDVARGISSARFPARGQRRHLAGGARQRARGRSPSGC